MYRNDILVGEYNTKETSLSAISGNYRVEYVVTDSDGETVEGSNNSTINVPY